MALKISQEINSSKFREKPESDWIRPDTKAKIELMNR